LVFKSILYRILEAICTEETDVAPW